jgi:lipopolysaccharide export system permease protein
MLVATGSMLLCFLLNLWITPLAQQAFREWQFEIRNQMAGLLLQDGVFSQLGSDLMVYARDRDGANNLSGILVHDTRERGVPVTIIAETGRLTATAQGPRVTLINGQRQQVEMVAGPDGVARPRLTTLSFQENSLDLARTTRAEGDRFRNAHERSLMELLDPDEDVSDRDRVRYRAEAHQRLANPLTALGLALLALAVALTGEFRRFGGGLRLFAGCAIMVALLALGLTLGSAAARQNALIPLVWLHAILPGLVSIWVIAGTPGLTRRLRQWAS